MATIVNNPQPTENTGNGAGFLLGVILLIIAAFMFVTYAVPYFSRGFGLGGATVNVPSDVNVHVNK